MEDLADWILKPILRAILGVLLVLRYLAWDLMFRFVGWSIGWLALRAVTIGTFPGVALNALDECSQLTALFVEFTGLAVLFTLVYLLAQLI